MATDLFDDEFDPTDEPAEELETEALEVAPEPVAFEGQLVGPEDEKRENPLALCRAVQNEVFRESLDVLQGAMKFADISEEEALGKTPPEAWIKELGLRKAQKAFRLARHALMPEKAAPAGLKLAANVFLGITKAMATERAGAHTLNVAVVRMETKSPDFMEIDVGEEDVQKSRR